MRKFARYLAIAMVALAFLSPAIRADDKNPGDHEKRNIWMKQKLTFSQNLLAALTEGDFEKITANAAALNLSGYLENWIAGGKPQHARYELQRATFDFYNKELTRQAKEKNIEGATLAFQLMTASCIECHKIVRDVKK